MSLKRRIEVFNQGKNQLNCEIEQLERKFLMFFFWDKLLVLFTQKANHSLL